MVTVVDAANLLQDYASTDFLRERGESLGKDDNRTLVDLLVDQIEFADVVVLNKIDAARPDQRELARKIIRSLNPDAELIETSFAKTPLNRILNTGRFDFARAQEHPIWAKELFGFAKHMPETEEYGIGSFVYRARKPFHPEKFQRFIRSSCAGVIRAKGHFWLATRPEWVGELSQAGAIVRTEGLGYWWTAIPKEHWPEHPQWRKRLAENWDLTYGDRRQELVFIGIDMDIPALRAGLDACLIEGEGLADFAAWNKLPDPFPLWSRKQDG